MSLPKIELANSAKGADVVVLGWFSQEDAGERSKSEKSKKDPSLQYSGRRDAAVDALASRFQESKHFRGGRNETDLLRFFAVENYPNVVNVGLGVASKWDLEAARQAGASVYSAQKRGKFVNAAVRADGFFSSLTKGSLPEYVQAFVEGFLLAGYEYKQLKSKKGEEPSPKSLTLLGLSGAPLARAVDRAQSMVDAVFLARRLGDTPPNHMTPAILAKEAQAVAKEFGLKCKVFGRAELEREKMELFVGVGKGSAEEPKMIVLEYSGGKKTDKPIALVGKGITFDTGGISIKPSPAMEEMKYDMLGAATVLAAIQGVAALKLPVNVVAVIAAAENMPSGTAQKPGDIQRSRSGKTVEITNTDAEGRLVLADALEWVQDVKEPQAIVDVATLTGAVVVALGSYATGIMGNNANLIEQLKKASVSTAERVWELPLYDEYMDDMKSAHADIRNSGNRDAGSSKGGIFLKFFVNAKFPWAHCDIAGTGWNRKDLNYNPPKGAAGSFVRLLVNWLENFQPIRNA